MKWKGRRQSCNVIDKRMELDFELFDECTLKRLKDVASSLGAWVGLGTSEDVSAYGNVPKFPLPDLETRDSDTYVPGTPLPLPPRNDGRTR